MYKLLNIITLDEIETETIREETRRDNDPRIGFYKVYITDKGEEYLKSCHLLAEV